MLKDTSLFYIKKCTNKSLVAAAERRVWSNFCSFNPCKGLNWIFQTWNALPFECLPSPVWEYSRLAFSYWSFSAVYENISLDWSQTPVCLFFVTLPVYFRSSFCLVFQLNCFIKRVENTRGPLTLVFRELEERVGMLCSSFWFETML